MKILSIAKSNNCVVSKELVFKKSDKQKEDYSNYALGGLGVCVVGAGMVLLYSKIKSSNNVLKKSLSEADRNYLENIRVALKKAGIDVKIDSLNSIVPPDEFKKLIKELNKINETQRSTR
jgi:flagellar biosynthesis/type III secretory pathway M-ring protein FliF/YscJ